MPQIPAQDSSLTVTRLVPHLVARNAISGSTRAARRAGKYDATIATTASATATAT